MDATPEKTPHGTAWQAQLLPYVGLALAFIAGHVLCIWLLPDSAAFASLAFLVAAPLLAAAACIHRSLRDRGHLRWPALALAMLLWSAGMSINALAALALHDFGDSALTVLLFVLYGVPLIFIAASPEQDPWPARLLDAVLSLALAALFLIHTFAFATMAGYSAAGMVRLRLMFDIENVFIVAVALLHWRTSTDAAGRWFFKALAMFAVPYLLVAAYINHLSEDSDYGGTGDVLIASPFLVLAVAAMRRPPGDAVRHPPHTATRRAVRLGSPLLLPVMLLVVAATLTGSHPALAIAGLVVGIFGYGLRNVLMQLRGLDERDRLARISTEDALTRLRNRRSFDESLRREWRRARRNNRGVTLLMIDIDHFKMLNDAFGHPEGDQRLRQVALALARCARRATDTIARYGGEEFVAILPSTSAAEALALAERMRGAVEHARLASPAPGGFVTISVGVGYLEQVGSLPPEALLKIADAALYEAKRAGRNQVVLRRE